MGEYDVVIPKRSFSAIGFQEDGLPGVALVNSALKEFEPKIVFSWHLSLIIDFEETDAKGMPTPEEEAVLEPFEKELDLMMQGQDSEKPNSLFLARITWNKTRELVWRVFDPEAANKMLQEIISGDNLPRALDYRIEKDPDWQQAEWHLS